MLDTVRLRIDIRDPKMGVVFNPDYYDCWNPSIRAFAEDKYSVSKMKYSRTLSGGERSVGYRPQVYAMRAPRHGGWADMMFIEFSAPKLFFGNNSNELSDDNLEAVCVILAEKLEKLGISISPESLQAAYVSRVDFSKNILLSGGATPLDVIRLLKSADISLFKEVTMREYSDEGVALHLHQRAFETVWYDKKKESYKHRKKSPKTQFLDACELPDGEEMLRIEARCNSPKTIRKRLSRSGIEIGSSAVVSPELRFSELFHAEISKKVLLGRLGEIEYGLSPILLTPKEEFAYELAGVLSANPSAKPMQIIEAVATASVIKECHSDREARTLTRLSNTQWRRIRKIMEDLDPAAIPSDLIKTVRNQLEEFKPIVRRRT